mmetsp:Transcript_2324/g.3971  ORF Transcript_2324/g.3971 Transcript_2324/m.3971 type:complete len:136 (+) Transcript_2324:222-629(+)
MCKRDVQSRKYSLKKECRFTFDKATKFPCLNDLKAEARATFDIKNGEHIEVCKFIPHEFEWRHLDANQLVQEKTGKKKKQVQSVKLANLDLRKYPVFLQDGDIIGVRLERENPDKTDDFQTDEDLIAKSEFNFKR